MTPQVLSDIRTIRFGKFNKSRLLVARSHSGLPSLTLLCHLMSQRIAHFDHVFGEVIEHFLAC